MEIDCTRDWWLIKLLSCKVRLSRLVSKLKGDFVWRIDYIKNCISIILLYRESSKYINVLAQNTVPTGIDAFTWTFYCNLNLSNRFTSSFRFLNCAMEMNFPLFLLFNAVTSANVCLPLCSSVYHQPWIARDIVWCVRYLRTKDAHKQLAQTSLSALLYN